jgi:hypothetical protein
MNLRLAARIILISILLFTAVLVCISGVGEGSGTGANGSTQSAESASLDATATFGAAQFHAQLTAIAQP